MLVSPPRLMAAVPNLRPALTVVGPPDPSTISTLPASFSATAGTIFCEFTFSSVSGSQVVWSLDDATANERLTVRLNAGSLAALALDGGATQCSLALGAASADTPYRVAFAWAANDFAACINGGSPVTDSAGTIPTVNRVTIGFRLTSSDPLSGDVHVLKYWPARLSNGILQGLR